MRARLFSITLALVGAGCAGSAPSVADPALTGPTWQLSAVRGEAPAGPGASLTFGAARTLSGTAGCNRLSGTYALERGGKIVLTPHHPARVACPAPAAEQERRVLAAMEEVERYDAGDGRLVLSSASGERVLAFDSTSAVSVGKAAITGRITHRPAITLPPNAVVNIAMLRASHAGSPSATISEIEFSADGQRVPLPFIIRYDRADVEQGRRYVLRAHVRDASGAQIWRSAFDVPVVTNGASSGAIEVTLMTPKDPTHEEGDVATGTMVASALAGSEWTLAQIRTREGAAVEVKGDAAFTLRFGADRRYSGQADCNAYGGSYAAHSSGALDLQQGLSTLAACPSGSVSDDFFDVLSGVDRYERTGGRLVLRSTDGGVLVFR